ncbi:hypothetical protein K469DRAFT_542180, partial [Zopfia rhizophila CBS 207.26]
TAPNDRRLEVCTFFLRNACTKGDNCPFQHQQASPTPLARENRALAVTPIHSESIMKAGLSRSIWSTHTPVENPSSRIIAGATVTFGDGAAVSALSLPSDFSAVSMSNIPPNKSIQDIISLLKNLGFLDIPPNSIHLKHLPQTSSQTAEVRVEDPDFAHYLLDKTGSTVPFDGSMVLITPVQFGGKSDSSTNRLQLTSVTCTWFNPSQVAYLHYGTESLAREAMEKINKADSRRCRGRKLNATYKSSPGIWVRGRVRGPSTHLLHVGNIDPNSSESDLKRFLPHPWPQSIEFGICSHDMAATDLQEKVKRSLEAKGRLSDWIMNTRADGSRVKAIAKFVSAEAARSAVKDLNDTRIDVRSNDRLQVASIVSIKMSVSNGILNVVRPQLHTLADTSWRSDYVTIKTYDNPGKVHSQVRIFGQQREAVARAKSSVEKILAGHVAINSENDAKPISATYFFQPTSDTLLQTLMSTHGVFIYRDMRKMLLRLYGATKDVQAVQVALEQKTGELAMQSHVIVLDAAFLDTALKGGFRQIVTALGKERVRMDITANPKRIHVQGSEKDLERARDILRSQSFRALETEVAALSVGDEAEVLCPVCWTPPEQAFKTTCGHFYCSSCLESQCASAGEADFPVRCLGGSATCKSLLTLSELKDALPANTCETTLRTSFTWYIRSRPTEFQYCPTPDCDRFYRISSTSHPRIFDCGGCLSSICTACHHVTHDGLTCEEYKTLVKAATDGEEEFAKWKKENDVRDCPNCSVSIEKSYGCNHMECKACGIHICWFCMETFKHGHETYNHMSRSHG